MREKELFIKITKATIGTFNMRQPFTPGMFEPLKPLFRELGYENVAVYIIDDFPDRMHVAASLGDDSLFPEYLVMNGGNSFIEPLSEAVKNIPGAMIGRLFNHGRELGALAVTHPEPGKGETRYAFDILLNSMSTMAYIERIRTNSHRERTEREVYFSQSLTSRYIMHNIPEIKGLRLGYHHRRSLEAGGDFYDFMPYRDGVLGCIGCCSGKGLRTVVEMGGVMHRVHRAFIGTGELVAVLQDVNHYLIHERKRSNQASLAFFHIDMANEKLTVAKAGRIAMMLFDKEGASLNISTHGGIFLGMAPNPKISLETFDFAPGAALFCATEGVYNSALHDTFPANPRWFHRALLDTAAEKQAIPLVKALFQKTGDRPTDSFVAISAEFQPEHSVKGGKKKKTPAF